MPSRFYIYGYPLLIVFISVSSFAVSKYRPAADLKSTLESMIHRSSSLNVQNCEADLSLFNSVFSDWMPESTDNVIIKVQGKDLLNSFFQTRLALHKRISQLSPQCISILRDIFRNLRASEDMIGLVYYQDAQITGESVIFAKQPIPVQDADAYRPYFLNPEFGSFQFKKGDLMITKGVSFISASISSVAVQQSLFSHIAYVYQHPETKNYGTIESYIGKGVDFYSIKEALVNENARILILRAKDQDVVIRGHDYIVGRVNQSFKEGKKIRYDYKMDFEDNEKLSCEEIAYDALNMASVGQFKIPSSLSHIQIKDQDLFEGAGLKNGDLMLPADMELDPRFDIVLDWTDYRLLRDNWRKDAIMSEIVRWVNEEDYILHDHFTASLGKMFWLTRGIPLLWPISARITGIPKDYDETVPSEGISLMANFKVIAPAILSDLKSADEAFHSHKGRWMSRQEMRSYVNQIRLNDLESYKLERRNKFHFFFRASKDGYEPKY